MRGTKLYAIVVADLVIGILILSLSVIPRESFAQITSPYSLSWQGKSYPVAFAFEGEGKPGILGMEACDDNCVGYPAVIIHTNYEPTRMNDKGANLTISLPMQLIAKLHGYSISTRSIDSYSEPLYVTTYDKMTAAFSEEQLLGYEELQHLMPVRAGCDSVTYEVRIPPGFGTVYLSNAGWGWIPEYVPTPAVDSKFPLRVDLTAANETFTLDVLTNAISCMFDFDQQQKKLSVDVQTPEDEVGYFRINMPDRLLGGNYTVLVDSKNANYTILGNTEETAKSLGLNDVYTVMEIKYPQDTKRIEIVGTSVVPEFTAVSVMILTAGTIAFVSSRYAGRKQYGRR